MRDFAKIEAWRLADDLTVAVYQLTRAFPKEEMYGLTSQLRRAASSVAANIAEGSGRQSKKDYLHFLYIARGSLAEMRYFIHLATRLGYLTESDSANLSDAGGHTIACSHGLVGAVEKEAGRIAKFTATLTSLLVISVVRFAVPSPWSLVLGRWS